MILAFGVFSIGGERHENMDGGNIQLDNDRPGGEQFDTVPLDYDQLSENQLDTVLLDDNQSNEDRLDTIPLDDNQSDEGMLDTILLDDNRIDTTRIEGIIESILFVSGEPISFSELARVFEVDESVISTVISEMAERMKREQKGIFPFVANDTVQLVTNPDYQSWLIRCFAPPEERILSKSLMETLSVIAYRQPVTRAEIEAIRGVRCEYAVSQLLKQGFIHEAGRKNCIGRPIMFATTNLFLRRFAIRSIDELPPLPLKDEENGDDEANSGTDFGI